MPSSSQRYTTAQLDAMRQRHGFSVRFLSAVSESDCIFEGQVQEHQLPSGLQMVSSDIRIDHGYESTSEHPRRFTAVVLLDGQAELQLPGASMDRLKPRTVWPAAWVALRISVSPHENAAAAWRVTLSARRAPGNCSSAWPSSRTTAVKRRGCSDVDS